MTDLHEEYFSNSNIWLIDGTFRMVSKNFSQILKIMGVNLMNNKYLTIGHIILKSKKENDYTNALALFLS